MKLLHCDAPDCDATTAPAEGTTDDPAGHDWHIVQAFPYRSNRVTYHACGPAHVIELIRDLNPGLHVAHRQT